MRRRDFIHFLGGAAASPFAALSATAQSIDADPPEPTPAERLAMAEAAKAFMQQYAVPGLSVAIGHSGRLIYQDAFGWADREAREEAIPAHLFRICSISKPITSVAVFTLIEEGRLRLDDKVFGQGAVLGTEYGHPPSRVDEITIEHLLTHTSGGWPNNGTDPMFHTRHSSQAELIAFALYQPLQNQPGHVFAYSNFGYCVLGRVIEKIVSQSYADFVRDSVLRRCGINDMTIGGDTLDERRSGEVRYYGQNGEDPYWTKVTRMDSCGGWIASPTDIVKFTNACEPLCQAEQHPEAGNDYHDDNSLCTKCELCQGLAGERGKKNLVARGIIARFQRNYGAHERRLLLGSGREFSR